MCSSAIHTDVFPQDLLHLPPLPLVPRLRDVSVPKSPVKLCCVADISQTSCLFFTPLIRSIAYRKFIRPPALSPTTPRAMLSASLSYPWISQFDENYRTEYYVNTEMGTTQWERPSAASSYGGHDRSVGGSSSAMSYSSDPYSQPHAASAPATGEAASYYGSAPVTTGSTSYSQQSQQQQYPPSDGTPGPDGERGLGKVIVAGGALWMAHKLYKDWQKQKLSSQQQSMLRPPSYAPQQYAPQQQAPQQSTMGSLFHGSGGGWGKREYADYPPAQERAFDPAQTYGDARLQQSWASDYTPSSTPAPTSYPYSAAAGDQQMFQQPAPQPYYGGQADHGSAQSGQGYSNAAIYENVR